MAEKKARGKDMDMNKTQGKNVNKIDGIGKKSTRDALRAVHAEDYRMDTVELITAKLIQTYLSTMERSVASQLMADIMADTVIAADPLEDETGEPISGTATVEGRKLAELIDAAGGAIGYRIEDELKREKIHAEIGDRLLEVLHGIDGKLAVQNVSAEFLCFLSECYRVLM